MPWIAFEDDSGAAPSANNSQITSYPMHICHSTFSLGYGTIAPAQLPSLAAKAGFDQLVLADINNTSGYLPFVQACEAEGIRPVLGIEFREGQEFRYIALARNADGLRQINQYLSEASFEKRPISKVPPKWEEVWIIYDFDHLPKPVQALNPNEFIGIRPEQVNRLFRHAVRRFPEKLLAFAPVSFLNEHGYKLHQLLRAIALNKIGAALTEGDLAPQTAVLRNPEALEQLYAPYPFLLDNTRRLLKDCEPARFETGAQLNRQSFTDDPEGDFELLQKLAYDGFEKQYPHHPKARKRLEKELQVIRQQGFTPYFLITWDFIRYAQSLRFYHVGRGSGANSLVAHCLGITAVDPIELDLYFERFINEHRQSPPDFDIDFDSAERDYVIDYVLKRYGKYHCALVATYETFQFRSIVEELGKVFGLDEAARTYIKEHPDDIANQHPMARYIHRWARHLYGLPKALSIHPGGMLITQRPLTCYTDLKLMPKGVPIVSFDMHVAEAWGFHKYDILGNRGIGHIREALHLIRSKQGAAVDIHNMLIIKHDPKVKQLMQNGQCVGAFYVESPAMRGLLRKLRCDNYVDLVAASSIIRPGVARSGMMREYIRRYHAPETVQYLHPVFEKQLGETFGVMVFQEDVLKILHHFAGLDLGESDVIRRLMSGKRAKGDTLEHLKAKYFSNCQKCGYSKALAAEVWRQVESFSGYSFCKAHSASYAVESLQSLYLKAYFPREFFTGVINNHGGFFKGSRKFVYFYEARKAGAALAPPCVNRSEGLCTLYGKSIFVGLSFIKGLQQKTITRILEARERNGSFTSLEDFLRRVTLGKTQLELLVKIGALRFAGLSKCQTYWALDAHLNDTRTGDQPTLTGLTAEAPPVPPDLHDGPFDQAFDEWELLGFPLCSPFDLLSPPVETPGHALDRFELHNYVSVQGFYIVRKMVGIEQNGQRRYMCYGCWYDSKLAFFDTTHYPDVLERYPFQGMGIYRITGRVRADFGVRFIVVESMERLPLIADQRFR